MRREEGLELVTGPWEAFALASIAPLGSFAQVHLAPKIPPASLNNALLTFLPLQGDELILALIDRGRGSGTCCALTTRRIYWEETAGAARPGQRQAGSRASEQGPVTLAAQYGALPETIPDFRGQDGSVTLDLAAGRAIVLNGIDHRLGAALARFLEKMSRADHGGPIPAVSEIDPDLAVRIPGALRAVSQLTSRCRAFSQDLFRFRSDLQRATLRPIATPIFIAACVVVFAVMTAYGVPVLAPSAADLRNWGANDGTRIVLRGESWRLFTSVFIHGGIIHLAVNMWSLFVIGPLVERLYGNVAFAVLYLAAGLGGAIASVAASPVRIGVGASGAICGVVGALVAFLITHRRTLPASLLKSLGSNVLGIIVFMVVLGRIVPNIDQEAHFGGLATGFLCGLLLYRPWPVVHSRGVVLRRGAMSLLIVAVLAGAAYGMTHRATAALHPSIRFRDIAIQLAPALDELSAIGDALPNFLALTRDRNDPEAHQNQLRATEELARRAARNRRQLGRARSPYPPLQNMAKALVQAQTSQISALDAARSYLETGDLNELNGPNGLLKMKTAAKHALQSFEQQEIEYYRANHLNVLPQ